MPFDSEPLDALQALDVFHRVGALASGRLGWCDDAAAKLLNVQRRGREARQASAAAAHQGIDADFLVAIDAPMQLVSRVTFDMGNFDFICYEKRC